MIANLLATALLLCILGVVFLLIAYLAYLVFAHWLRFQNPARLLTPEAYSLRPFSTRNIRITTSDGLRLGAWHILPLCTPRETLERIHASEQLESDIGSDRVVNEQTDAIFEDALKTADTVVLYFHGQVGDRGKSNRIATYKGIQEAVPSAHVITIDCRGYGDSEGFPSEAGFKIDSFAAWQWVTQRVRSEKVVIYGHSLGSGIATNLCLQLEGHQHSPLAMVLDAAFTSMPDMMTTYRKIPIIRPFARFPFLLNHFKLRIMDRFETVQAVETIRSPLLLIHGQEDADVLISNSHTLFHTALSARRLESCTGGFAGAQVGEDLSTEEHVARAGFNLPFEQSHSTDRDPRIHDQQVVQRSLGNRQLQKGDPSDQDSKETISVQELHASSIDEDPEDGTVHPLKDPKQLEKGRSHTVQLEFPREGSLEYNQEYQIGFLTVQYAVHNTCMDFAISKQVLGTFLSSVESRRPLDGLEGAPRIREDLVKVLCHDKIGSVDRNEVPEVVE
ncbi:hypothetical protein BGX34_010905 [Mortierella sp. NVP85]|nr:hypothetical protein BGX34_010905 [Mortierella sp. NVP85]